jgi:hypothetical protein
MIERQEEALLDAVFTLKYTGDKIRLQANKRHTKNG